MFNGDKTHCSQKNGSMGFQPFPSTAAVSLAPGKSQLLEAARVWEQHSYCPSLTNTFAWVKSTCPIPELVHLGLFAVNGQCFNMLCGCTVAQYIFVNNLIPFFWDQLESTLCSKVLLISFPYESLCQNYTCKIQALIIFLFLEQIRITFYFCFTAMQSY